MAAEGCCLGKKSQNWPVGPCWMVRGKQGSGTGPWSEVWCSPSAWGWDEKNPAALPMPWLLRWCLDPHLERTKVSPTSLALFLGTFGRSLCAAATLACVTFTALAWKSSHSSRGHSELSATGNVAPAGRNFRLPWFKHFWVQFCFGFYKCSSARLLASSNEAAR